MLENYNRYRILQEFFKKPTKKHQLRELSRATDISLPTVKDHVEKLQEMGFVEKNEEGVYPGYEASRNDEFKLYKKLDLERKLHLTGLVDHLNEKLSQPDAIVLFGSAANGEDIEESDIDILAVCKEKDVDLKKFEKKFNRKINIQFIDKDELKKNNKLANSIANGIVLSGYLVVK